MFQQLAASPLGALPGMLQKAASAFTGGTMTPATAPAPVAPPPPVSATMTVPQQVPTAEVNVPNLPGFLPGLPTALPNQLAFPDSLTGLLSGAPIPNLGAVPAPVGAPTAPNPLASLNLLSALP
jgi:hypothetical protein